jgi:hypothetical protein
MSRQITLVYQTDVWHTHKSRVLIAICEEKGSAIETIGKYVYDKYKAILTEHDEFMLNTQNQTQGDTSDPANPFEGEFVLEEVTLNDILI